MPSERISDELIDELLAGASTEEEIAGPGGLLAQLTKRLVERAMEVELSDHVGYEAHCEPPGGAENQRNGTSPKTSIAEHGKVEIDAPRDRLPRATERSPAMDENPQLDSRPARVQDPLRRPRPRHCKLTVTVDHQRSHCYT